MECRHRRGYGGIPVVSVGTETSVCRCDLADERLGGETCVCVHMLIPVVKIPEYTEDRE